MRIRNVHTRSINRPAADVFRDLERLGTEEDTVWPAPSMPFQRTPGPLRVGETRERHGIIRAALNELEPGRKMVWRADQPFLQGTHGFELTETASGCSVEHVLQANLSWWFAPVWIFKIASVHDRIIEGILDRLEPSSSVSTPSLSVHPHAA
ncbi:MAG: hypothetical protein WBG86_02280 [Polyangiales bacterium]